MRDTVTGTRASELGRRQRALRTDPQPGQDECWTPRRLVETGRAMLGGGIDLDPASSAGANERVRAGAYYDIDDDGLTQPWHGRVWLNPPFRSKLPWLERWLAHDGPRVILLPIDFTASRTGWPQLLARADQVIVAPNIGRWDGPERRSGPLHAIGLFGVDTVPVRVAPPWWHLIPSPQEDTS